jgi:hypothetical protein
MIRYSGHALTALVLSVSYFQCQREAPISASQLIGCWKVERRDGRPLGFRGAFWNAGMRLDTVVTPKMRSWGTAPGEYAVRSLAPIPDSSAADTILFLTTWRIAAANQLVVSSSNGFSGPQIELQPVGDSLRGVIWQAYDVADWNRTARRSPVIAHRIRCPSAAPPA